CSWFGPARRNFRHRRLHGRLSREDLRRSFRRHRSGNHGSSAKHRRIQTPIGSLRDHSRGCQRRARASLVYARVQYPRLIYSRVCRRRRPRLYHSNLPSESRLPAPGDGFIARPCHSSDHGRSQCLVEKTLFIIGPRDVKSMTQAEHINARGLVRSWVFGLRHLGAYRSPRLPLAWSLILLCGLFFANPVFAQDQAKRLVALLDYLGSDYKNAVKDGKILSQDEFAEMQEFAKRSLELFNQLKEIDKADKAGIESNLKTLARQVEMQADPPVVAELAKTTKDKLIAAYQIVPHPRRLPSLATGKRIYDENCAQCHGATGKGDGPGRDSMNPKTPVPANFIDPERIGGLSPFKVFNTASFGVEGTAMASFAALSEE